MHKKRLMTQFFFTFNLIWNRLNSTNEGTKTATWEMTHHALAIVLLNGHVTSYIKENFTWIHIRGSRLINHCSYAVEQEEKPHEKQYALCSLLYCGQKRFNMRQSLGSLFPKIIFKHKINHKKSIIWCKCRIWKL